MPRYAYSFVAASIVLAMPKTMPPPAPVPTLPPLHCEPDEMIVTTNTALARTIMVECNCQALVFGVYIITTIIVWYSIRKKIDANDAILASTKHKHHTVDDDVRAELHHHDHNDNDNEASNPLVDENEESGFGAFVAPGRCREISSPNAATTANASATADSTTEDAVTNAGTSSPACIAQGAALDSLQRRLVECKQWGAVDSSSASPIQDQTRDQDQDQDEDENVSIFCQIFSIHSV